MEDWDKRGIYEGYYIWVIHPRDGKWIASVAAIPQSDVFATARPGDECVPGEFDSDNDAAHAAKQYIDQKQR
jgi:hypothetical protein